MIVSADLRIIMQNIETNYMKLLFEKYGKVAITKKELCQVFGISLRTLNARISKNMDIPAYKKGNGRNSKIMFPIAEVAKYLNKCTAINQ